MKKIRLQILKENQCFPNLKKSKKKTEPIGGTASQYAQNENLKEDDQGDDLTKIEKKKIEEIEVNENDIEAHSRDQLVDMLEETVKEQDISLIKKKVSNIKVNFLKLNKIYREKKRDEFIKNGGNLEEYIPEVDKVEEKFKTLFDVYKQNKARFNKSQEELKLKNLELKKQILEDLKALNNSEETLKNTYDEFKLLQEKWKEIGIVPQAEINNLWQSYHFLIEMFFDKVKINKELRDLDLKKNLELKVELCEKNRRIIT